MSELCLCLSRTPTTRRTHLSTLLKSDFFLFSSFIISHPIHFTFFISFSSYIHRLLSFLFPLFLTTSLFLLAFLTFVPNFVNDDDDHSSEIKVRFLAAVVETLRYKIDNQREEHLRLEDFEVFRIVFVFENPTTIHHPANADRVEASEAAESTAGCFQDAPAAFAWSDPHHQDFSFSPNEELADKTDQLDGPPELTKESNWSAMVDDKKKSRSLWEEELDDSEVVKVTTGEDEMKKIAPSCTEANKGIEKQGEKSRVSNGSEAAEGDKIRRNNSVGKAEKGREHYKSKLLKAYSHSLGASVDYTNDRNSSGDYSLGSYGSMRKEKEWKRTLACKLFEERNNGGESEGMDLLWETYEAESTKNRGNGKQNKHKKREESKHRREEDETEEEEDSDHGQLCCLQALKLSTGKMNLGMGRPNLVKISKAIKGIGWLNSLRKQSKKVHNGDKD